MSFEMILSLLGGLALFLYGMQMMSSNLEAVAGGRMKDILERLTSSSSRWTSGRSRRCWRSWASRPACS